MATINRRKSKKALDVMAIVGMTFVIFLTLSMEVAFAQETARQDPYQDSIDIVSDANVEEAVLARHVVALGVEDLAEIADIWQRRVQTNLSRLADGITRLDTVSEDQVNDLVNELKSINALNIKHFQNYLTVVGALGRKGGPEKELKRHEGFIRGFISELLLSYRWVESASLIWDWVRSGKGGVRLIGGFVQAIIIFFSALVLGRTSKKILGRWLKSGEVTHDISATVIPNVVLWGIILLGLVLGMWSLGISVGFTTTVIGGLGFLLAFMLQNFFQSVIGGFLLQATNPYTKGDVISINQVIGTVVEVNIISTTVKTFDNRLVQFPNQTIWQGSMENLTKYRVRRVDLVFGIGYKDDIELARSILADIVDADTRCLKAPKTMIVVGELGPSSVNIFCRPWVRTDDYWDVMWDLLEVGKTRLQDAGILIAYPQMDVHVHDAARASIAD